MACVATEMRNCGPPNVLKEPSNPFNLLYNEISLKIKKKETQPKYV